MDYNKNYKEWLNKADSATKEQLLAISDNDNEIKECFSLPLAFGTAGMRGIIGAGTYRMNEYTVRRATKGLADYILSIDKADDGVVVAYDTRIFSYEFALAVARVLSYNKIKVFLYEDVRPVPMCSFAIRETNAIAGVMITASHNPKEYNGYKVYGSDGAQMSPDATDEIVNYIEKIEDYFSVKYADVISTERSAVQGRGGIKLNNYITVIGETIDKKYFDIISKLSLSVEAIAAESKELKIVYTPIHGTGYKPVMRILKRMGLAIDVVQEQISPDGRFPTVTAPNPENADTLKMGIELAEKINSEVVIGTDPDGDRMGIALRGDDNNFYLLNGNQIGVLLLDYILTRHVEKGTLPANAAAIKTIVTTSLAKKVAENFGIAIYDVLTGFKYIGEKIKQWEIDGKHTFVFGYEESYGYLCGTHARDKDAVVASMLFAEMVAYYKYIGTSVHQRLQELFKKYGYYVDKNVAITYKGLDGMQKMATIMDTIRNITIKDIAGYNVEFFSDYNTSITTNSDGSTKKILLPKSNVLYYGLEGGDWVCVRPSGTEPKLKVYVSISEKDREKTQKKADAIINYMIQEYMQ